MEGHKIFGAEVGGSQFYRRELFVAKNHAENFATLKITLKNNIKYIKKKIIKKKVLLKITLKRGLCYSGMQKTVDLSDFYPN